MRTINATLPKEMPPVGVEMEYKSYHNISTVDNKDDLEVDDGSSSSIVTTLKKSTVVKLSAVIFIVIACMLLVVSRGPANGHVPKSGEMQSVNDAAWMGGASVGTTYCKTSCTSQCSSYFSVYGPLCCDWAEGAEGTKFCAQSVTKEGKCECGISTTSAKAGPADKPRPTRPPAPAPSPHDDSGFHPFPTMAWMPWDDDNSKGGGGGGGWEPFRPFKPIKVPEHSVPCKAHCENACGYSNGMCCEYSASGDCDMTTIDGKCYCGTD